MSVIDDPAVTRRARRQIARRRGALIGLILIILGAWGTLIPFIGPYFHYAYTPDHAWRWTASRGWLEVLPGALTALGGLLVVISSRRPIAILGAWLAAAGGAWFAIGTSFEPVFHTGAIGTPNGSHPTLRTLETIGFFYGLGVVIVFFAATASGRLSVRSLADIHVAQRELAAEADATIRTHDAKRTPTDADAVTKERRHESQKCGDTEQVPRFVGREPAANDTIRTTGTAEHEHSRPSGAGATAAPDIDRDDDQSDRHHT